MVIIIADTFQYCRTRGLVRFSCFNLAVFFIVFLGLVKVWGILVQHTTAQIVVRRIRGFLSTKFYKEALSLVYDLTSKTISPDMLKVLELMYQVFQKDGFDYFTDMMPALHNYVTVDTPAFLSNENHVLAVFNMCKAVLTGDAGEDPECHAAKLLEVIILQCKGHIDQCIPSFVELVLQRLTREVKTSELRTMCLQVVIAALYYNPQLHFQTLEKLQLAVSPTESITSHFIKQWLHDTDCFLGLHDRKLCVLGLCTLLTSGARPVAVNEYASQIVPSHILLFDGLKRAYVAKAQEVEEEEEDEEESDIDQEVLSSDEDEIDETSAEYLEKLQEKIKKATSAHKISVSASIQNDDETDDELDDDYEANEETALETYTTPLDRENCEVDEYIVFKEVLQNIQASDPAWYQALTVNLTPEQQKVLAEVMVLADQRKAAAESKKIEQSGAAQKGHRKKRVSDTNVMNAMTAPPYPPPYNPYAANMPPNMGMYDDRNVAPPPYGGPPAAQKGSRKKRVSDTNVMNAMTAPPYPPPYNPYAANMPPNMGMYDDRNAAPPPYGGPPAAQKGSRKKRVSDTNVMNAMTAPPYPPPYNPYAANMPPNMGMYDDRSAAPPPYGGPPAAQKGSRKKRVSDTNVMNAMTAPPYPPPYNPYAANMPPNMGMYDDRNAAPPPYGGPPAAQKGSRKKRVSDTNVMNAMTAPPYPPPYNPYAANMPPNMGMYDDRSAAPPPYGGPPAAQKGSRKKRVSDTNVMNAMTAPPYPPPYNPYAANMPPNMGMYDDRNVAPPPYGGPPAAQKGSRKKRVSDTNVMNAMTAPPYPPPYNPYAANMPPNMGMYDDRSAAPPPYGGPPAAQKGSRKKRVSDTNVMNAMTAPPYPPPYNPYAANMPPNMGMYDDRSAAPPPYGGPPAAQKGSRKKRVSDTNVMNAMTAPPNPPPYNPYAANMPPNMGMYDDRSAAPPPYGGPPAAQKGSRKKRVSDTNVMNAMTAPPYPPPYNPYAANMPPNMGMYDDRNVAPPPYGGPPAAQKGSRKKRVSDTNVMNAMTAPPYPPPYNPYAANMPPNMGMYDDRSAAPPPYGGPPAAQKGSRKKRVSDTNVMNAMTAPPNPPPYNPYAANMPPNMGMYDDRSAAPPPYGGPPAAQKGSRKKRVSDTNVMNAMTAPPYPPPYNPYAANMPPNMGMYDDRNAAPPPYGGPPAAQKGSRKKRVSDTNVMNAMTAPPYPPPYNPYAANMPPNMGMYDDRSAAPPPYGGPPAAQKGSRKKRVSDTNVMNAMTAPPYPPPYNPYAANMPPNMGMYDDRNAAPPPYGGPPAAQKGSRKKRVSDTNVMNAMTAPPYPPPYNPYAANMPPNMGMYDDRSAAPPPYGGPPAAQKGSRKKRVSDTNVMNAMTAPPYPPPYNPYAANMPPNMGMYDDRNAAPPPYGGPPAAQKGSRKKRVSDTNVMNAMTAPPYPPPYNPYAANMPPNMGMYDDRSAAPPPYGGPPEYSQPYPSAPPTMDQGFSIPSQFLNEPIVANVAMQYGQALVGSGKQLVDRELEKYVPVSRLKYYFAVDTGYVTKKLSLLFFPFTHADWSVKYEQDEPVQPRYEINAPDLYIPTMAYVTYVLVAGLVLGMQDRFSPEMLGIQASSALAWTVFEIIVEMITLYITNIQTNLKTLDLLAYGGYKYVGFDIGNIVNQASSPIKPTDTGPELKSRLAEVGANLLLETLECVPDCLHESVPQPEEGVSYAPRVSSSLAVINWRNMKADQIFNLHRALVGLYPLSTSWHGLHIKLLEPVILNKMLDLSERISNSWLLRTPGYVEFDRSGHLLRVLCADGHWIGFRSVAIPRRKPMSAHDFYNGYLSKRCVTEWLFQ